MLLTAVWLCVVLAALYLYFRQQYSVFSRQGVKTPLCLPILGNMGSVVLKKVHFSEQMTQSYFAFPNERFIARYEFTQPMIMIRDLELIKRITVKDFDHFIDHRNFDSSNPDPFFSRSLLALKGQEWRDMRSTLSPAFTSSKIRVMVPFMVEVGDQMIKALKLKLKESDKDYIDVDVMDLTTRYANDVIASCAFGLKVDSHIDVNNKFYTTGKNTFDFKFSKLLVILGFLAFPKFMKFLNFSLFDKEGNEFFRNIIMNTMKNREEQHIIRPDMIHLLIEAKKGSLKHDNEIGEDENAGFATVKESHVGKKRTDRTWTDDDLVSQAILFLLGGFQTVSSAMSFLLYELAVNPDVQEKLVREIKENDAKNEGKFDYTSIQNLTYMDMVMSEVLRRWPPNINLDRICVKDYNFGKPNSSTTEDFILRRGTAILIPTWALHLDPGYFPEPYKFDPERFSEENKHKINPFVYMPFGSGPRNCIGSRFALCEMKVMVYQLLQHIEISPGEKTCIPAELCLNAASVSLKGGHWVRFRVRNYD